MKFSKEIKNILKSNKFLVYIRTEEEERLEYILKYITNEVFKTKICSWNFIDGYQNNPNYLSKAKQNPLEALNIITEHQNTKIKAFYLKDFDDFIKDISIIRKIKNLYQQLKHKQQYIIISGTHNKITQTLEEYITYTEMPLPSKEERLLEIRRFFYKIGKKSFNDQNAICMAYSGFSMKKIRSSLSQLISDKTSTKEMIKQILKEKKKAIYQTEGLKYYSINNKKISIGGLCNLKRWLKVRSITFTQKAYFYGIKAPKGILLVGVQGTGKSISAQAIASEWNLPLLRLNISNMFAGILGESENKIEKIINTCRINSPCILWIDEIDKIFSNLNNSNDSGTRQRVTNIFLTWLSEKTEEVFIVATANTIDTIPPEFLRKGRFDEIFFVDLPTFKERCEIFQVHLKKIRPTTWNKYNIYYLSKVSQGFSGAEIEQSVTEAMYLAFNKSREFTTQDVIKSVHMLIPLSKVEKEKIRKLRKWGYSGSVKIA
uniref:Uncharacterized AAA domain-containing protein ycf46 n=1 Tax=Polysiphonia sp. TaxID=1967842 RepID=A0A1Z1MT13_9FLOR|nr:hypothetical protein [Polysiphonia sp.]